MKRKGLDRSSTFKGRLEKEKERGGVEGVDSVAQQQLLTCAVRLKDSLKEILVRLNFCPVKCCTISQWNNSCLGLNKMWQDKTLEKTRQSPVAVTVEPTVMVPRNKLSPKNSPPMCRPHLCHLDIADLAPSGGPPLTGGGDGTGDSSSPHIPSQWGCDR